MQATSLSRVVEHQGGFSGPWLATSSSSVQCAVRERSTAYLKTFAGSFSDCSCSNVDSDTTSRARAQTGRRTTSFLSAGRSGALFQSAKFVSPQRLPLGRSLERSVRCYGTETTDKRLFPLNLETSLNAVKSLVSKFEEREQLVQQEEEEVVSEGNERSGSILTALAVTLLVLAAPSPTLTSSSLTFSDSARADQLGQLKQAAGFLEKGFESLPKVRIDGDAGLKVLEKAVTVVTGSAIVDPKALDEEVDALLSGKRDIQEEFTNGVKHAAENFSSSAFDVLTNFNPGAMSEEAGASISAFLETGAERIAAFELSALVSLGERWLILTPLLVLPMAWEMNRVNKKNERELREGQEKFQVLSGEAALRGEKVKRELERIELRASVLEAVSSLGKAALEPPRSREAGGLIRRRIKDILERLEDLRPVEDPLLTLPEFASVMSSNASPGDALAYVPTSPTVDGDWHLIYVSENTEETSVQEFPQFPGFGLDNLRQKVWQSSSITSLIDYNNIPSPSPLLARNSAEVRLGPLGVFKVGVEGSWENLKDGERALVSFNTFSARPVEILGNKLSEDVPEFNFSLPPGLQRSAEWAVAYVDDHLRINRGNRGQLFLFRKME